MNKIGGASPGGGSLPPSMDHIPVRKLFWDALEVALEAQTHRLAKDVATALGKPEGPLIKALRDKKVKAYLYDTAADQDVEDMSSFRCNHVIREGPFLRTCDAAVLWAGVDGPRPTCLHHTLHPNPRPPDVSCITPLKVDDKDYYVCTERGEIYNAAGRLCGRLLDGKAVLFEIE